jgi:uncharacterized protein
MPTMNDYKHGTFSWVDLGTTDAEAAKRFYGNLFGWTFDDVPAGVGTYSIAKLSGQEVCALYKMGPEMKGVPPFWLSYISVDDVDTLTKAVTAAGGRVDKEPFDVMDVGRMSVVSDPTGASFAFWQAKTMAGAKIQNEPGALCWNELFTNNVDRAGKFYVQTLGWKTEAVDMGRMGTYTLFKREGETKNAGGMLPIPSEMKGVPPHWLAYFGVASCDAATKKAADLGAKTVVPPTDIPQIGRFSIVQDPQGAVFALFQNAH